MSRLTLGLAAVFRAALILPWFANALEFVDSDGDEWGPAIGGPFNWSQVDTSDIQMYDFNLSSLETAWASPFASTTYTNTGTPGYNLTIGVTSVPGEALNTGLGVLSHPNTWGNWPMAVASIEGPDLNLSYACLTVLIYYNDTWQDHAYGDDGSCQTALSAECLKVAQDTTSANTSESSCYERRNSFNDACENFSSVNYAAWTRNISALANNTWPVIMTWATDNGSGSPEMSTSLTCARANSKSASLSSSSAPSSTSSSGSFAKPTPSISENWLLGGSVLIGAVGAMV